MFLRKKTVLIIGFILFIAIQSNAALYKHTGKLSSIRTQDVSVSYGSGGNYLDVETVIKFDNKVGYSFGFKLREGDKNIHANQGMLDLLRDALKYNWDVEITYSPTSGGKAGTIVQVTILK